MRNQKETQQKKLKLRSKSTFKHGAYAIAITAVVIAAVIVVNLLVSLLANRVNLNIDLSLKGENTLSAENLDYLKQLDQDVSLTVCAKRDDYEDGQYLNYYTAQSYSATASTADYYQQTVKLLDQYVLASAHITLDFVDPQSPEFSTIQSQYADAGLMYGDIIVESTRMIDGQPIARHDIVTFDDVYYLQDTSGYAQYGYDYYYVQGNNLETALTSAIYKVTTGDTKKATVMQTHCSSDSVEYLTGVLQVNNFDVAEYSDTLIRDLGDADLLVISAPKEDFAREELEVIDAWLYNNGNRGRGLLFFASIASPELPNLYEYLEEWGISYDQGVLFETDSRYYFPNDPSTILFVPTSSDDEDVRAVLKNADRVYSGSNVAMQASFEHSGHRTTAVLTSTAGKSAVSVPKEDLISDQIPDGNYVKNQYPGAILSADKEYSGMELRGSYVIGFSSTDYISSEWVEYTAVDNMDIVLRGAKLGSGADNDSATFSMKTIASESFADQVSERSAGVIFWLFVIILPVILIAFGVVVFVRRRRR